MAVEQDGLLWPVRFAATTYVLRVTLNGVTEDLTFPLAAGTVDTTRNYWLSGDSQADADGGVNGVGDLYEMLRACLAQHTQGGTWAIADTTSDGSGQVKITHDTHDFTLVWLTATTLDGSLWGFDTSSNDTSSSGVLTAPNRTSGLWFPNSLRLFDSRLRQPYVGAVTMTASGLVRVSRTVTPQKTRVLRWHLLDKAKSLSEHEPTTDPDGAFETAWTQAISKGWAFRLYEDMATTRTGSSDYTLLKTTSLADPITRDQQARYRFAVALQAVEVG